MSFNLRTTSISSSTWETWFWWTIHNSHTRFTIRFCSRQNNKQVLLLQQEELETCNRILLETVSENRFLTLMLTKITISYKLHGSVVLLPLNLYKLMNDAWSCAVTHYACLSQACKRASQCLKHPCNLHLTSITISTLLIKYLDNLSSRYLSSNQVTLNLKSVLCLTLLMTSKQILFRPVVECR